MVRPAADKASILPLFPLLSSHDGPTRLDASVSLISSLPVINIDSASSAAVEDADTPYALKRLVNGLGSSNAASRQGFAVALAELVARLPPSQAETAFSLIVSSTTATGGESKDEPGLLFGRLLGLHALVRSEILFTDNAADRFKEVILALHNLSTRKSWMREPAYWVLVQAVRTLLEFDGQSRPSWTEDITEWLVQRLLVDSREKARGWSADKIALVLILQAFEVDAEWDAVLSPTFASANPLARTSLVALAQAIKGGSAEADSAAAGPSAPKQGPNAVKTNKPAQAAAPGAPHFVWSIIFEIYFPQPDATSPLTLSSNKAQWADVWRLLVDQAQFGPSSVASKATGFSLLQLAIQRLPPAEVPALFGEATVRTFSNNLRKSQDGEKTLSRIADKLSTSLQAFATANPTVALPLIKALVTEPHGSHQFDQKTIEKLVSKLNLKAAKGWAKWLKEFALGEEQVSDDGVVPEPEDEKFITARRMWAFDQLLHLAKSGSIEKDDELLASLLEFFAVLGWFEVRKSGKGARSYVPVPAYTDALQTAARSRFFSILTALPTTPSTSGLTWLSRALALLDNLSADTKNFAALHETEEEVVEARESIRAMYAALAGDEARLVTARGLIEGVLLLSYDEGAEASEALDQLADTIPALFPDLIEAAPKESDSDEAMASEDEGDEPEPATVLVDILLELLHRPSAFVKGVVQTVFIGFADELGEQGMELILEQIRPEVDENEEEEEDVEMDDHAGHDHGKKKAPAANESEAESSDDDVEEVDGDGSDFEVDEAFKNELLAALQANGVADEFDAQDSTSDDDEELLDDDQMMALDDKLADIFRLNGGGNKGKKVERLDDMHYKLRVLDLLEAFAKQRSSNPLLVLVLLPLFGIVQSTNVLEGELRLKAGKLLRHIVAAKVREQLAPADPQLALDALAELHTIAKAVEDIHLAQLCSQTAFFLVKAALASPAADAKTGAAIAKLYADSFGQYLSKKNAKTKVQPLLTIDFCRRAPATAWALWEPTVALASGESASANVYRRMQAFEVVHALLTSQAAIKTDESKARIVKAVPAYRSAILSVLKPSQAEGATFFDASKLKEVAKLALAAIRITLASSSPAVATKLWKPTEFSVVAEELREIERYKGAVAVQNLLKQIVTLAGGKVAESASNGKKDKANGKRKNGETDRAAKKAKVVPVAENEVEVEVEEQSEVEEPVKVAPPVTKKEKRKDKKKSKST